MKVKNKTLVALPLIGLCFSTLLFSCSRDDEKPIDEGTKVVFSVTVSSTHLYVGETAQIEIELTGLNSNKCNFTVNEAGKRIVSVDENGLVTAIGVGQAKITVTAADNLNYKKDLYFDVYQGMGERDEDLGIMVDEISSKDFENGVRFHGTVSMNLGTLVGGTVNIEPVIPFTVDVQNKEEETNLKVGLNIDEISITSTLLDSTIINALRGTIPLYVAPSFEEYLDSDDLEDTSHLDIYNFLESDYYVSAKKDFANVGEKSFAFAKENIEDLMGENGESTGDSMFDFSLISSMFEGENADIYINLLWAYLETEKTENGSIISLSDTILNRINESYIASGKGGDIQLPEEYQDYQMVLDGLYLPDSFSKIYLEIDNSGTGDEKFKEASLNITGVRNGQDYDFMSITIEAPYELPSGYMNEVMVEFNELNEASSRSFGEYNVASLTKRSKELEEIYISYQNEEISELPNGFGDEVETLRAYYEQLESTDAAKYLLDPMNNALSNISLVGSYEVVYSSTTLTQTNNSGTVTVNTSDDSEEITNIRLETDNSDLFTIVGNTYTCNGGVYTGEVGSYGILKDRITTGNIKATFDSIKDGVRETHYDSYREVSYLGTNGVFPKTIAGVKAASGFDTESREINMSSTTNFNVNDVIDLPLGAFNETMTYQSTREEVVTIDSNGLITKVGGLTSGIYAGIKVNLEYQILTEKISEMLILFVKTASL